MGIDRKALEIAWRDDGKTMSFERLCWIVEAYEAAKAPATEQPVEPPMTISPDGKIMRKVRRDLLKQSNVNGHISASTASKIFQAAIADHSGVQTSSPFLAIPERESGNHPTKLIALARANGALIGALDVIANEKSMSLDWAKDIAHEALIKADEQRRRGSDAK